MEISVCETEWISSVQPGEFWKGGPEQCPRFYSYSNIRMNWFTLSEPTPRAISNLGVKFMPTIERKK